MAYFLPHILAVTFRKGQKEYLTYLLGKDFQGAVYGMVDLEKQSVTHK